LIHLSCSLIDLWAFCHHLCHHLLLSSLLSSKHIWITFDSPWSFASTESIPKLIRTIFLKNATMKNEDRILRTKNEIKIISHLFLKNIRGNIRFIQTKENLLKVYKSHTDKCFISIPITDMSQINFASHFPSNQR